MDQWQRRAQPAFRWKLPFDRPKLGPGYAFPKYFAVLSELKVWSTQHDFELRKHFLKKRKHSIRKKLLTNWVSDLVVNDGVNGNCDGIRGQNLLWLETGSTNLPFFIDFQLSTLAGISKLISRISTRMKSSVHGKIQKFPGPWGPPSSFPNRNFTARSYCETTL